MKVVNKTKFILFIIFVILLILAVAVVLFYRHQLTVPLKTVATEMVFNIKKGEGVKEIALHLEREGLIRNKTVFEYYIFFKDWGGNLQAGEYLLSPTLNIPQITKILVGGEALSNEIQITIPEGFTLAQIDARLANVGLIKEGVLKNRPHLEGYLFPDTYRFNKDMTLDEITAKMRNNFDDKLNQERLRQEIQRQGKTIPEVITMASIVQNEAVSDKEMPILAGVFYNRLELDMLLQSDATVNYITKENRRQATLEDIKIDSPYNTYIYFGLPPGPISNPGLSAIKAALFPEETDYLYFLHPLDSEAIFSKTLEEHNGNKDEYLP